MTRSESPLPQMPTVTDADLARTDPRLVDALSHLNRIGAAINRLTPQGSVGVDATLRLIAESVIQVVPGASAVIYTYDAAEQAFELFGARDSRCVVEVFRGALPTVQWPGRFEILSLDRPYILDGAHNLEATLALVRTLENTDRRPSVMVFGALAGKPVETMLEALSTAVENRIFVRPPIGRSWDPGEFVGSGDVLCESVSMGLAAAEEMTAEGDTVLVTGSLFTVAEARRVLLNLPADPQIGL